MLVDGRQTTIVAEDGCGAINPPQPDAPPTQQNTDEALSTTVDAEDPVAPTSNLDPPPSLTDSNAKDPLPSDNPSLSEELWNDAWDKIEAGEESLVKSYALALKVYLKNKSPDEPQLSDDEFLAQFNDRAKRQEFMKNLLEEGKKRVARTITISNVVGNIAQAILRVKPAADVVLTVPQAAPAALPWAGVCVGLEVGHGILVTFITANALDSLKSAKVDEFQPSRCCTLCIKDGLVLCNNRTSISHQQYRCQELINRMRCREAETEGFGAL